MGANGTFSKGLYIPWANREYKTIFKIDDNIIVLQRKDGRSKLPEESHTAGRIYVLFKQNGSDVKSIAKYGDDHKKLWEIHTDDHKGIKPHAHDWYNGGPINAKALTAEQMELLNKIRNFNYGNIP